jgi:peptidoglycan/xylan/chitin deacetylase (PgdA/CDA1 family)
MEGDEPTAEPQARMGRRQLLLGGGACAFCAALGFRVGRRRSRPDGLRDTTTEAARAKAQPDAVFDVRTPDRVVALSFDDGPDPKYTPQVLDLLNEHDASATFFIVGVNALAHRDLVAAELAAGHTIGNHTYDHPDLERLGPQGVDTEVYLGEEAIVRAGAPQPHLFRPPKGYTDEVVDIIADVDRYRTVFWDMCVERYVDHDGVWRGTAEVLAGVRPGVVILAHDGGHIEAPGHPWIDRSSTLQALPLLLDGLAERGYRVVDVPTLLALRVAAHGGTGEAGTTPTTTHTGAHG